MTGVKVFVALTRKDDVSEQYFHDHWRHPHATWGLGMAARKHYVQSHKIATAHLDLALQRYDGVAEIWFENVSDAGAYNQDPVYKEKLAPDEPGFISMRHVRFLVADQEVLVSGPAGEDLGWREQDRPVTTKLLQFFDPAEAGWASDRDIALGGAVGAFRHVRSTPNQLVHAKGAFVSGIRELWWPTLTAFEEGVSAAPAAWAELTSRRTVASILAVAERHL